MRIMAVDLGDSRTGIAFCDKSEFMASPYTVIFEKNFKQCTKKAAEIAKNENAELIVVGLPKKTDNTIGEKAEKCMLFGERLEKMTGIHTVMWDERYTTVSAHMILNETNVRGQKRKNVVDAVAAVLILESYLEYRKNTGGV